MSLTLGLLGRNISHSRSKINYEEILNKKIDYELFDYESKTLLPDLDYYFTRVKGLSITAPYKEQYFEKVKLSNKLSTQAWDQIRGVNCIRYDLSLKQYEGTNTDYLAFCKIFNEKVQSNKITDIFVLGSGPMARTAIEGIRNSQFKGDFHHLKRSTHGDLSSYDFTTAEMSGPSRLIINACSRSMVFSGRIYESDIFWCLNYSLDHPGLSTHLKKSDGLGLLKHQAIFALDFWGISY